ncbi:GNAT family N-acetyltransferase [Planktothrix mougeotii]|uniref:GNAT family N-acetyltransferase n=1 Tax=Planktothrix mougeotii LEGE 06226 TaxID=1828728 RepID=A0ABR9U834_9CYAN|nr:GNAT family N-acetyltransferase [Planktothrix mougeotii]MBE9142614.1 GNAT family N-acetyltransferase [Planktothrix mougeotii LEGE 06226]
MIKIRPYLDQDWPLICRVHDRAQPAEFLGSCDLRAMTPLAHNPNGNQICYVYDKFVACKGKTIVGFVAIDRNCIALLYIDPDYQNQGIGKRLLNLALKLIGSPAYTIVMAGNQRAIAFYQKAGFQEIGSFKSHVSGYPCRFIRLIRLTENSDQLI